jgi:glycosyltransferase involved in cell wall biosynthesis
MSNLSSSEPQKLISVVIATLGGESLLGTIEQLNRGTLVPAEVLVCIPAKDAYRVEHFTFSNVRVIKTNCRGQVAQRAVGFGQAQYQMVMQLDDDVMLPPQAVQILVDALSNTGPRNAVGPLYFDALGKSLCHEIDDGLSGYLNNMFTYVVCAAPWGIKRMGAITVIGTNYGVDSRYCGTEPFETQWLPGACVLCYKEDLVTENYFPFSGKAYCEDVIHSHLRKNNRIHHWIIPEARCFIDAPVPENSVKSITAENRARRYFLKLSGGPAWRLAIYEAFKWIKRGMPFR